MAETPPVFAAAAAWAQARPFGCAAGAALRGILLTLTGPPRVSACTLSAPVPLQLDDAVMVSAAWPVAQPGVDVCFLIHPEPLPPRVRSRMAQGPALFLHVSSAAEISTGLIEASALLAARTRILRGELLALALRHPELAEVLRGLADLVLPAREPTTSPTLAVIGPVPARCRALATVLAENFRVLDSGDVDAVVAVAAPEGWNLSDAPTLIDARNRVGRLISTAPLPVGVAGPGVTVVGRETEIPALLRQLLARPRAAVSPDPEPGNWRRAMSHLRRQGLRRLEREVNECTQTSQLAAVAERHGLGPLPERSWLHRGEPVLVACLVGVGVGRLFWPLHPVLAVVIAVLIGAGVGVARWRQARRRFLREAAATVRQQWMQPDITTSDSRGPIGWLRHELMVRE